MIEPAEGEKKWKWNVLRASNKIQTISSGGKKENDKKKYFSSVGKMVNFRSKNVVSTCAERIFDVHMMTLRFDSGAAVL